MMPPSQPGSVDRVIVRVDRDLEEIVPVFLANRKKDLQTLRSALADQDFKTIQTLGHRMKGDGGGYGFDRITEIGAVMELAATQCDHSTIGQHIEALEDFLARLLVEYC